MLVRCHLAFRLWFLSPGSVIAGMRKNTAVGMVPVEARYHHDHLFYLVLGCMVRGYTHNSHTLNKHNGFGPRHPWCMVLMTLTPVGSSQRTLFRLWSVLAREEIGSASERSPPGPHAGSDDVNLGRPRAAQVSTGAHGRAGGDMMIREPVHCYVPHSIRPWALLAPDARA